MLKIVPTTCNTGYWITAGGQNVFNHNLRHGLENCSESIEERIASYQASIDELRGIQAEVDAELEKQGGKLRPRRAPIPETELWYSTCSKCKKSDHNINMVAVEVTIGGVKVFCWSCGKKKFPSIFT